MDWQLGISRLFSCLLPPRCGDVDQARVAQGRVDPEVVAPVDPAERGGAELLLGPEGPSADEFPLEHVVGGLGHGVVVRVPGLEIDLSVPRASRTASVSVLQNSGPRSLLSSSMTVSVNSMFEKFAFASEASLRPPHEQPATSLLHRSTSRQT